ncbi:uncharacterized protein LOC123529040 [Mercenaria mercenaria]|uniref:uncharacterized protein LOC123529040 n=1 Tax=Mercenaria mercenaria TaxID=6596 RepID=UPI00234EFA0F|nr:uncharacterized protein LOC123529040 [Mercenaria mercenaria]
MTSIPVRKGTTGNRRSGIGKENADHNSHADNDRRKHFPKENKHNPRPLTRQSSKKELEDESGKLHEEIQTYEKRLQNLESTLNTTKEELKQSKEESTKVKDTCERTLLLCNIDPVTVEKISPKAEDECQIQHRRNQAKVQVSLLQEKLHLLNTQASACIQGLQEISAELDHSHCIQTGSTNTVIQPETGTLTV